MTTTTRVPRSTWLACVLLACAGTALAEPCALSVSQSRVDLGDLLYPQRAPGHATDAPHVLGTRQVAVQVHCPTESSISVMLRGIPQDNGVLFAQRGELEVQMHDAVLDGRPVMLQATDMLPAAPNAGAERTRVLPGQKVVPMTAGQPARGSNLTLQMSLTSTVPLDELVARDSKTLSASINLEVIGQ
ncbi:hypothetical protein [Pseudomonas sp. CAM1A]|uniref:hypothetical protein n=1 Tax=Pseudomonas sp. CAM1A TaxID=3231717 RepID=UPI0039C5E50C